MALSDKDPEAGRYRPACSVGTMLGGMPSEDREVAERWLKDRVFTPKAILTRLREEGYDCALTMITTHRKGECSCYGSR